MHYDYFIIMYGIQSIKCKQNDQHISFIVFLYLNKRDCIKIKI